jgi:hypothetical protein
VSWKAKGQEDKARELGDAEGGWRGRMMRRERDEEGITRGMRRGDDEEGGHPGK